MPCTITGSFEGDKALMESDRALKLTQLLCAACKRMETTGTPMPTAVKNWWAMHKEQDQKSRKP